MHIPWPVGPTVQIPCDAMHAAHPLGVTLCTQVLLSQRDPAAQVPQDDCTPQSFVTVPQVAFCDSHVVVGVQHEFSLHA